MENFKVYDVLKRKIQDTLFSNKSVFINIELRGFILNLKIFTEKLRLWKKEEKASSFSIYFNKLCFNNNHI